MFSRYASAISTSTIMTLGLIYIMQSLITLQPGVITDPTPRYPVDWVRVPIIEDPPQTREHQVDRKDLVEPIVPPDTKIDYSTKNTVGVPLPKQTVLTGPQLSEVGYSDGPLVTMINVQPTYPIRASQAGIEGHVIVEFDVDANGRPLNIRVIEATHNVFIGPSMKAAERIKFKARVVDGTPVMTTGVRKLFRFEMEDE